MSNPDVFALDRTGFNGFLFASIGTETNGSPLTVLSTLARLGDDPWLRAATWATMLRPEACKALAACITAMPLTPEDIQSSASTAERLIRLLNPARP